MTANEIVGPTDTTRPARTVARDQSRGTRTRAHCRRFPHALHAIAASLACALARAAARATASARSAPPTTGELPKVATSVTNAPPTIHLACLIQPLQRGISRQNPKAHAAGVGS